MTGTKTGILVEKEPGLQGIFRGSEHSYVRCVIADPTDPTRQFECRVLDAEDLPVAIGEPITLEVLNVVTDRKSGKVRFDCHFIQNA
jgi:hypothetical protein